MILPSFKPQKVRVALSHLNNGEISVFFWGVESLTGNDGLTLVGKLQGTGPKTPCALWASDARGVPIPVAGGDA